MTKDAKGHKSVYTQMYDWKEKGITLVALVVTIIVLLILAGVTLSIALDNGGLIGRTKIAKEEKVVGDEKEQIQLAYASAKMGTLGAEITERDLNSELTQMLGSNEALATVNEDGTFNVHYNKTGHDYTVTDGIVERNIPEVLEPTEVYAKLYNDGTLILSSKNYTDSSKTILYDFGKVENKSNDNYWSASDYNTLVTKVSFYDRIVPSTTAYYFNNLTNLTSFENMSNLKTGLVTDMQYMFAGCTSLTSIDVSKFDTSNVTNMAYMFAGGYKGPSGHSSNWFYNGYITTLDLSNFNTLNVNNMEGMFQGQVLLNSIDVSSFDTTNVTNMAYMFKACTSLTTLDLSSFNTRNVRSMAGMFNCDFSNDPQGWNVYYNGSTSRRSALTTIYVSDLWNIDNVGSQGNLRAHWMFAGCVSLKGAISYNSGVDQNYANYTTGYLTYKSNT